MRCADSRCLLVSTVFIGILSSAIASAEPAAPDKPVAGGAAAAQDGKPDRATLVVEKPELPHAGSPWIHHVYLDGYELGAADFGAPVQAPGPHTLVVRALDDAGEPVIDDYVLTFETRVDGVGLPQAPPVGMEPTRVRVPTARWYYVNGYWMAAMIASSVVGAAFMGAALNNHVSGAPSDDVTPFAVLGGLGVGFSLTAIVPAFLPWREWDLPLPSARALP